MTQQVNDDAQRSLTRALIQAGDATTLCTIEHEGESRYRFASYHREFSDAPYTLQLFTSHCATLACALDMMREHFDNEYEADNKRKAFFVACDASA